MFRFFLTLGSVVFEVATMASHGAFAATLFAAATIITAIHLTSESLTFQWLVNRLTGFDLPEFHETHFATRPLPPDEVESRLMKLR
jgi:hypothetical protein